MHFIHFDPINQPTFPAELEAHLQLVGDVFSLRRSQGTRRVAWIRRVRLKPCLIVRRVAEPWTLSLPQMATQATGTQLVEAKILITTSTHHTRST